MKTYFLLLSIFISLSLKNLDAASLDVTSGIKEVTVYLSGAQITRHAGITLQKGATTLVFRNLPLNIDPQSIQARGEGNFVILSLVHQVNYMARQSGTREVKLLEDSLKIYTGQLALNASMMSVMKNEEELLIANRETGGSEKGVVLAELKQLADFFRSRLTEIKKEELKLNRDSSLLTDIIDRIKNQLNSLNISLKQPVSEVLVNVSSDAAVNGGLLLTYTVFQAGWTPAYDIRAKDIQSPVELFYNAHVFQNTGEPWENVSIKLSTANPQQRGEKPDLQPWYIDFEQIYQPVDQYNSIRSESKALGFIAPVMVEKEDMAMPEEAASTASSFTEVTDNQTNLEFDIKIPYDIPSDNKQYTINIQDYTLPAFYEYYCAPKLDREAFLLARITGWEDYNLLSGEMNLFFEGTYVGKSFINVRNTNDTLDLSLGRDKGIIVTRVKLKDYTSEKTMGSNKREARAWEITVRNTKKQAIDLRIEDQLPISQNKDIEVEVIDYSGGKFNKETGLISWKQRIEPSGEKKFRISFAVKYPKDRQVFVD